MTYEAVKVTLNELSEKFVPYSDAYTSDRHIVTAHDCWQALYRVMIFRWLVLPSSNNLEWEFSEDAVGRTARRFSPGF